MKPARSVLTYLVIAIAFVLLVATGAQADPNEYIFRWNKGDTSLHTVDEEAGIGKYIDIRYNSSTGYLSFEMNLEPPTLNPPEYLAKGFWLVISDGRYPAATGAEWAIYYFDASNINNPILTVYPYNADDSGNESYSFMNARTMTGVAPADQICSSQLPNSCVKSIDSRNEADGSRTYKFVVDTTPINNFSLTTPNVFGLPWNGTYFSDTIGLWLTTHGHPDHHYHYGDSPFLIDMCIPPGADHLGFFDGEAPTDREPECEGPSETAILEPGDEWTDSVTCVDPDGDKLTATYSGLCNGMTGDPASGASANGEITVDFSYTPTQNDRGTVCDVDVSCADEDGFVARCPFKVMIPPNDMPFCDAGADYTGLDCLGSKTRVTLDGSKSFDPEGGNLEYNWTTDCEGASLENPDSESPELTLTLPGEGVEQSCSVFLTVSDGETSDSCQAPVGVKPCELECQTVEHTNQIELDGLAFAQRKNLNRLLRRYVKFAKGTSQEGKAKRYKKRVKTRGEELYEGSWIATFSVPSQVLQCQESPLCFEVSYEEQVSSYETNSSELLTLSRQTNKRIRKLGQTVKGLYKKAKQLHELALVESSKVPTSASECL